MLPVLLECLAAVGITVAEPDVVSRGDIRRLPVDIRLMIRDRQPAAVNK